MNKRAIALLSLGHFLIDFCQGVVPALVPFLVLERHFSYTAAAGLVFAISATSSVVQPLFGQLADRLALPWLLPASVFLAAAALSLGAQSASYGVVLTAFGLSGLGVAAFHPEAARKAYLASGDRRTTGMSLFSVGGGLGFATGARAHDGRGRLLGHSRGCWRSWRPPRSLPFSWAIRSAARPRRLICTRTGGPTLDGRDDWRAFGILSGATICRSIVFYGLNTFLALYFIGRWHLTAAQGNTALVVFLGTSIIGTLLGGWLADRVGRRTVIRTGFAGAVVFLALFLQVTDRNWALAVLVPLAVFIFMPTSVLVVLGQEYLAPSGGSRVGGDAGAGRQRRRDVCAPPGAAGRLAGPG